MVDLLPQMSSGEWMIVSLAVKSTVLLVLSLTLARLLLRKHPTAEDVVWFVTLVMLLLLPALELMLPKAGLRFASPASITSSQPLMLNDETGSEQSRKLGRDSLAETVRQSTAATDSSSARAVAIRRPVTGSQRRTSWRAIGIIYVFGVTVYALRIISATISIRHLRLGITNPADSELLERFARMVKQLGIRRPVRLMVSPTVQVPLTYGTIRPVVLLPSQSLNDLPSKSVDVAMLHELVHVARWDYPINWMAKIIKCVYWFNPLVHMAASDLRRVRESVCDGYCVASLEDQAMYIEVLMSFARQMTRSRNAAVGLAMVDSTRLSQRLRRIAPSNRFSAPATQRIALMMIGLLVTCTLAMTATAQHGVESDTEIASLTIDDIVRGLQANEQRIQAIEATVHFDDTFNFGKPGGGPPAKNMIEDDAVRMTRVGTVHWEMLRDGRARMESRFLRVNTRYDDSNVIKREEVVSTFDGSVSRMLTIIKSDTGVPISRQMREHERFMRTHDTPFALINQQHEAPVSKDIAEKQGRIVEQSTWQNTPVLVVEVAPVTVRQDYVYRHRYWVDTKHGYLVVRMQSFVQRGPENPWALHLQTDLLGLTEVVPGIWLPAQVETRNYHVVETGQSHLTHETVARLTDWRINGEIGPERFKLEPTELDKQSLITIQDAARNSLAPASPVSRDVSADAKTLRDMVVKTVDSEGQPVAGVQLRVNHAPGQSDPYVTDEQGQAIIQVPDVPRIVRIWAEKQAYVPMFANWEPEWQPEVEKMPHEFTFTLTSGTAIGGVVVNTDGVAIPGVSVDVALGNTVDGTSKRPVVSTWLAEDGVCKTDADGRWQIDNVPPGEDVIVRVKLSHPDFVNDQTWGGIQSKQGITMEALRTKSARFVMSAGIRLRGAVLGADGDPVANGVVIWGDDPYEQLGSQEVSTDANGAFVLPPLEPQSAILTIVASGWMPVMIPVDIREDIQPISVRLERGKTLRLKFVDTDGQAIPNALVSLRDWRRKQSLYTHRHSNVVDLQIPIRGNEQGDYEWTWAPADEIRWAFGAKGFEPQETSLSPNDDGSAHVITLQRRPEPALR